MEHNFVHQQMHGKKESVNYKCAKSSEFYVIDRHRKQIFVLQQMMHGNKESMNYKCVKKRFGFNVIDRHGKQSISLCFNRCMETHGSLVCFTRQLVSNLR
jgi:adenine deaminase